MAAMRLRIAIPAIGDFSPSFRRAIKAVGVEAVSIIRRRTAAGIDMHGKAFAPYVENYRADKVESGRTGSPDLTLTGQMLGNLQVLKSEERRVTIGFSGQHRASHFGAKGVLKRTAATTSMAGVVIGLHKRRPFFGIQRREEIEKLVAVFKRVAGIQARTLE